MRLRILIVAVLVALVPGRARADLPAAVVERSATLPAGMVELHGTIDHEGRSVLGIETLSAEDLDLAVRWGVAERLELGLDTALRVHPDTHWIREATFALAWKIVHEPRLELAPTARLPLFADHGYDIGTHLDLGLGLRFRFGERWLLVLGRRLTTIDFRPAVAWHVALDGEIGYQITPTLELAAGTQLGVLTVAGPIDRSSAPWSALPMTIGAVWAVRPGLDATAVFGTTAVQHAADGFLVALGIAVRP